MVDPFTAVRDVSAGSWIAPRLGPFGGDVGSNVPRGFEAYARVLHPVRGEPGPGRWAAVCSATGRQAHALMQWESIAGPEWSGGEPELGNLAAHSLARLCDVLTRHTPVDARCFFGVWEGYGWGEETPASSIFIAAKPPAVAPTPRAVPPVLSSEVINGPRLRLPHRSYFLFSGPLGAALALGERPTPDWFIPQSPNVFWPEDRSWYVVSEIDFDSTLVGGSERLIVDILDEPILEVWPIGPDDSLAEDGDAINGG